MYLLRRPLVRHSATQIIAPSVTSYSTRSLHSRAVSRPPNHGHFQSPASPTRKHNDSSDASLKKLKARPLLASLSTALSFWVKSPATLEQLQLFGLSADEATHLLSRFLTTHRIGNENMLEELRQIWALDFLEAGVRNATHADDITSTHNKVILLRFLKWAATQPSPSSSSLASDRSGLSSPYADLSKIANLLDMRNPASCYPLARRLRRRVIMHVGPTNSGKTYNALVALVKASNGLYAGPLRLLAHEIFDRLNKGQIAVPNDPGEPPVSPIRVCNLITGEERRIVDPDAPFTSVTAEMINVNTRHEVAVLDEIQLLADPERGQAWTKALLGLRAKELHLCGEESAVDIVRALLAETGDEIIVKRYERLTPLVVSERGLRGLQSVKSGDCVVAFSRSEIFRLKGTIEAKTGLKCTMAYGGLPPETRVEQAQLFNDPSSGYDVMVASDAVGMGLNLKIGRVVFSAVNKFDGKREIPLSTSQIKQIAGRAGRFGQQTTGSVGVVTTLRQEALPLIRKAMRVPVPSLRAAVLGPSQDTMEQLAAALPPTTPFEKLFNFLHSSALIRSPYVLQSVDRKSVQKSLEIINRHDGKLSTSDCLNMLYLPLNYRDPTGTVVGSNMIQAYCGSARVQLGDVFKRTDMLRSLERIQRLKIASQSNGGWDEDRKARVTRELADEGHASLGALESLHRAVSGYLWMSYRTPPSFSDQTQAFELKKQVEDTIEFYLTFLAPTRRRNRVSRRNVTTEFAPTGYGFRIQPEVVEPVRRSNLIAI
ncbi:RNA helicase [Tulasnella sp. 403]|nr:RNA helicase [Tulasnella sp. 403]